jgi:tetratricopeptide (TPR) repeat protein
MGGVRNGKDAGSSEVADTRQRSPAGLSSPSSEGTDLSEVVERHRRSAARLLGEGQAARAFGELVRASRTMPMSPRLAAVLVAFSLHAGTEAAAIALLSSALGTTRGDTRRAVRLQLARLLRRVNQLPRAIEMLQALVDEAPGNRRASRLISETFRRAAIGETTPVVPTEALRDEVPQVSEPHEAPVEAPARRREPLRPAVPWNEDESTGEASRPAEARFTPPVNEAVELPIVTGELTPTAHIARHVPAQEEAEDSSDRRHTTLEFAISEISPPEAPRQENPDTTRIEAQLIARRAWRELAQFYLDSADRAKDLTVRAVALTRLAELLENELQDTAGAARVYGQIVALTGDQAALTEQVRLLSQRADGNEWVVRRVLDEAVQRASNPRARAAAFLARGERLLSTGELARARADFESAEALAPGSLPALMGLVRCVTGAAQAAAAERLRVALASAPRRTPNRSEGLRCLAELAAGPLGEPRLAHWAWSEVLSENPEDVPAQDQLLALARRLEDGAGLSRLLRARIAREPRGLSARRFRLELVATLESLGDRDSALTELRQAVRFEPGHKEAWLLLVERLIALEQHGEAAWAMEHAATATEDAAERLATWERLARFCRDVLGDAARMQVYANRAENLRRAIAECEAPAPHPEPPRSVLPRHTPAVPRTVVLPPPPPGAAVALEPKPVVVSPASLPTVLEMSAIGDFPPTEEGEITAPAAAPALPSEPISLESTQVLSWVAPPGKMGPVRRRARGGAEVPPTAVPILPPAPVTGLKPAAQGETRPAAFERVRERPLDANAYRELSAFFSARGDTARASLMGEVASALAGEKEAVPRPPRRTLTPEERAGLRHPGLRNPSGELLATVGYALCRLFPTFGRAAGTTEPLRADSGPGARAAQEALLFVSRVLDVPLPEVCLSEDDGPPFTLVHPGAPRVLVGRLAVRQVLPEAELRFFAGRALSGLGADLLALRCLRKDQLLRAVAILASVLTGGTVTGPEARVVRDALHPKSHERARVLLESAQGDFDATALAEAARHSANRTGLVACGGPGPAVAALRALKSSEQELTELVRFAASERYLPLRD